jgi:hypothetical protein
LRGNIQSLNLASSSSDAMALGQRPGQQGAENRIRTCFSFTIPHDPYDNDLKKRSQVRHLKICNLIIDRLCSSGFEATKARPAKPWGAAFRIEFDGFRIVVMLVAKRLPRFVKCDVLAWSRISRWRTIPPQTVVGEWLRVREAMEKVLLQDLKADSLQWLTEDQLADQQESGDSASPRV